MDIKMYDAVALGELLIDFTPYGLSENNQTLFEQNPGGAPANVLASLSKWGMKTAFLGKVGDDPFGHELKQTLKSANMDVEGLHCSKEAPTTLAFVQLSRTGERSFSFYRNPGADQLLTSGEVKYEKIARASIFHFGSISMTHEPSRSATIQAVQYAKKNGKIVSFDPNLRVSLWDDLDTAKEQIFQGMSFADILKLSIEELEFLTGTLDLVAGTEQIRKTFPICVILVTLGREGSFARMGDTTVRVPGFDVQAIDATGAGDAFLAGILYQVLKCPYDRWNSEILESALRFANAAGALATTKKGAIPAIPSLQYITELVEREK
jgi:sugar/nucleoside kinase (ribokinase family)